MKGHPRAMVAILDAGGQYVDMVAKAVERLGYPAAMLPLDTPVTELKKSYRAVVISGSPANPGDTAVPMPDSALWDSGLPVLGICFGMQAMALAAGGTAVKSPIREDGRVTTQVDTSHPLFRGVKADFTGLFTHGVFVSKVPAGFQVIGQHVLSNGKTSYSAIARGNQVGVQFHPEVFDDTPEGYEVFRNFFARVAALKPDEQFQAKHLRDVIAHKRAEIKKKVAGRKVIAFMSGGVDSSVAAALALPVADLEAFYIDTGYMRDEDEEVIDFLKHLGLDVRKIDACQTFAEAHMTIDGVAYGPLETTADPQAKRRLIGKTFIDVQNDIIAKLGLDASEVALLQGTNAADRIESGYSKGDAHTHTIKTHHNLVPEARDLDPIEPLDDLFKDEIRSLGAELGLPEDLIWRQPFPGPALAIRILHARPGEYQLHSAHEQKQVRDYVAEHAPALTAALLPVRSVGVGGDERSHLSAVALHGKADWPLLAQLATDLPAHFRGQINRVVYALGDAPLGKLTVTPTDASAKVRTQLRHADRIVFEEMRAHDIMRTITQFPVVLLPLAFGQLHSRSIVLRPVTTSTFMTVQAMLPGRDLPEAFIRVCAARILAEVPAVSQVFLDLTPKPPATTEWE